MLPNDSPEFALAISTQFYITVETQDKGDVWFLFLRHKQII